eukprot:6199254-Pleurochrysis_carterae.AAC.3
MEGAGGFQGEGGWACEEGRIVDCRGALIRSCERRNALLLAACTARTQREEEGGGRTAFASRAQVAPWPRCSSRALVSLLKTRLGLGAQNAPRPRCVRFNFDAPRARERRRAPL